MENLQTLLKEMTYIEEVNDSVNKELAEEKQQHEKTKEQLATRFHFMFRRILSLISVQFIGQLEFKVERQDKQLQNLIEKQKELVRAMKEGYSLK